MISTYDQYGGRYMVTNNISEIRKEKHLSQDDLAVALGVCRKSFNSVLPTLDKVCGVKHCPKLRQSLLYLQALCRRIAVDAFFVFVAEDNVRTLCGFNKGVQPFKHRVDIRCSVKAEQADMLCS